MVFEDGDPTAVSLGLKALADDRRADRWFGQVPVDLNGCSDFDRREVLSFHPASTGM